MGRDGFSCGLYELFRRRIKRRYEDESDCLRNRGCVTQYCTVEGPSAIFPTHRLRARRRRDKRPAPAFARVSRSGCSVGRGCRPTRLCGSAQRHDGKGAPTQTPSREGPQSPLLPERGRCILHPAPLVVRARPWGCFGWRVCGWPLGKRCP